MAQPTNLVSKYDIKGDREDLIEAITNTSPEKTPVVSSFGRATATNTYHEWQRDSLRSANKDNAAIDGDDATPSARSATNRVANYSQIFKTPSPPLAAPTASRRLAASPSRPTKSPRRTRNCNATLRLWCCRTTLPSLATTPRHRSRQVLAR